MFRVIIEDLNSQLSSHFNGDLEMIDDYESRIVELLDKGFNTDYEAYINVMTIHFSLDIPLRKIKLGIIENNNIKFLSFDSIEIKKHFNYKKVIVDRSKSEGKVKEKDNIVDIRDYDNRKVLIPNLHMSNVTSTMNLIQLQDFSDGCDVYELPYKILQIMPNKPFRYCNYLC